MKARIPMTDFAAQWAAHIEESSALRMKDDTAEQAFWKRFMQTRSYAPDASSRQVLAYLRPLFAQYAIETALEIGPGWGNYTLDLAACCREVACVDLSAEVLDFIRRTGAAHGLHNLTTYQSKWESFVPDQRYDVVFGYNCFYRQADLPDCFARMQRAARKLCVAGMNTGLAPVWAHELEAAGAQVRWEWKDYMYFVGVLYQMGIDPNVRVLPFTRSLSYPDLDALVQGECARCDCTAFDPKQAADILCRHFSEQPDGSWTAEVSFRSGIVWWEVPHGAQ